MNLLKMFKRNKTYKHKNSKGTTYWLHAKEVELRHNHKQIIYYFSMTCTPEYAVPFPKGFKVQENPRNGFLTMVRTK